MRNYDKRMAGYLIEHPAVTEQVERLAVEHGEMELELHIVERADLDRGLRPPGCKVGDLLWRVPNGAAGIIHAETGRMLWSIGPADEED